MANWLEFPQDSHNYAGSVQRWVNPERLDYIEINFITNPDEHYRIWGSSSGGGYIIADNITTLEAAQVIARAILDQAGIEIRVMPDHFDLNALTGGNET